MIIYTFQELNGCFQSSPNNVYIAGAGNYGRILGDYFNRRGYSWRGFLDKAKKGIMCGKDIIPFDCIPINTIDCIVVSAVTSTKELCQDLINMGINEDKIITFYSTEVLLDIFIEMNDLRRELGRIERFKNKHQGRRCFVIGNGPSLRETDLDRLKDEITFASNSIYAMYEYTAWRPTYYGISDSNAAKMSFADGVRQRVVENCDSIFGALSHHNFLYVYEEAREKLFFFKDISFSDYKEEQMVFSGNAADKIYTSSTITYILLQLAVYMGIHSIYLLGVDFTFSVEKKADGTIVSNNVSNHNRYIETEEEKGFWGSIYKSTGFNYLATTDYQRWGYKAAQKYAASHGIKIYNATRGGKLDVFERVDFDTLF